ncbi:MAG: PrsW family intramembrane metalloprotease [Eubacterium sp.]|nr:PrsW family intramembrane metalloprotease [Eubacterium sp.]
MSLSYPIVLTVAIIPTVVLMIFIYFQDNHEKEPISLLLKIFGLGVLSCIPVLIVEILGQLLNDLVFGGAKLMYYFSLAFFCVAPTEEFFKFMAAYLLTWRNKHFNYKFDGIVYCLFGSMGFAAIENVKYLIEGGNELTTVMVTGIGRALLAIPCHAMCGIFMGYFYGNAKYLKSYGDRSGCRRNLFTGFAVAVCLHGFYDFCLFTGNVLFLILFVIFVIAADVLTIIRIVKAKKENAKMYEAPKYRQYWVDANPYQPYGGYAAPVYGGYNYANASGNNGGQVAPYAPPVVATGQSYNPEVVSQGASYSPQAINQGGGFNPQPQYQEPAYNQQTQATGYVPQQTNIQDAAYSQQTQATDYVPQQTNFQDAAYNQQANAQNIAYNQQSQAQAPVQANYQQNTYNQGNENVQQQAAQPVQQPVQTLQRTSQIHCPVCGTINYFNAFNCNSCGASLHQL